MLGTREFVEAEPDGALLLTTRNSRFETAARLLDAGTPVEVAHAADSLTAKLTLEEINIWEKTRLESVPVADDTSVLRGVVAGDYPVGLATVTASILARIRSGELNVLASGGEFRAKYLPDTPTLHQVIGLPVLAGHLEDTTLIAPDNPTDHGHTRLFERARQMPEHRRGPT